LFFPAEKQREKKKRGNKRREGEKENEEGFERCR